jgi:hypothetical protein
VQPVAIQALRKSLSDVIRRVEAVILPNDGEPSQQYAITAWPDAGASADHPDPLNSSRRASVPESFWARNEDPFLGTVHITHELVALQFSKLAETAHGLQVRYHQLSAIHVQ